ncbi:MAG: TrkH family potassium uptake protein [Treponema sp.]|jgi:trk system potassium uptake protein TrkH|nr:TrkH family potassium uptake protein [Treponema sp.]
MKDKHLFSPSGLRGRRDSGGLLRILAFLLAFVTLTMLIPLAMAALYQEREMIRVFGLTIIPALLITLPALVGYRKQKAQFSVSGGFLLVCLAWVFTCLLGTFPYYLSGVLPRFIDAFFESVSGFSTTGATIIADVESMPRSLLFWRAMTHWLGGMGIVVLTVAILPLLGVTGFQLVKAETTGPESDKIAPRITTTAKILWFLYMGLTVLQAMLLMICGMDWFDAVYHAFSTIATGGFSSRNTSIAAWNSPWIDWVCIVFMILAGFNFNLLWQLLRGKYRDVLYNSEARAYALVILVGAGICAFTLYSSGNTVPGEPLSLELSIRQGLFQSVSFLSSTGFGIADHTLWPPLAQVVLFLIMFTGGCSGSTAGGIKLIRHVILFKQMGNEMKKLLNPRGVFSIRFNGKVGRRNVVYGVAGFVFLYMALVFTSVLFLCAADLDIFTSINLALQAQGNIGLGLGQSNFCAVVYGLPAAAKGWLCFIMIAGRLELWTVFALFSRIFRRR